MNEGPRSEDVELLRLRFDQEKWKAEFEIRKREQTLKEREQESSRWTNPLVVAILAAALAALGNAIIAVVNENLQRELETSKHEADFALEQSKAESARILEMIKTGNADKAADNLKFLLDAGLVSEKERVDRLRQFLSSREPGTGPSLPVSGFGQTRTIGQDTSLLEAIKKAGVTKTRDPRVKQILEIAANSPVAHYNWGHFGVAPIGYIKGMAAAYALAYCNWRLNDPASLEMAKAASADDQRGDALSSLKQEFAAAGMRNDADGADTLRHLFVLLTSLGMMESSGRFSSGIDISIPTSEAGLFSSEFTIGQYIPFYSSLLSKYANSSALLDIFLEGVSVEPRDLEFVVGPGDDFQRISKRCPAFAVEIAALGLRKVQSHWGPIVRHQVKILPECDEMFRQVQKLIDDTPNGVPEIRNSLMIDP